VGDAGDVVGLDHFGASAPYQRLYQEFGITAGAVADRVRARLG
jgi:transketolase